MNVLIYISTLIMPLIVMAIIMYGLLQKVDIYGAFVRGAKEGIATVSGILPTLIGLLCAVKVLRESGVLDLFSRLMAPVTNGLGIPSELIPLGLMKMFSSSGATSLLTDIFKVSGPDSFAGQVASVMLCSTETIVYTMSIYFVGIGIKDTRHTLKGAIIANVAGMIGAYFVVMWFFY